ncbi:putative ribonuclease H-like domain-containing protein, partial [Tanacetum coccineum]
PPPPTGLFSPHEFDFSNSGLKEFQQREFEGYGPKTSKSVSKDISNEVRESLDAPSVKELANCNYHQRERVICGNNYTRVNDNYSAKNAHPSDHGNMVPRADLMKIGLRSLNTARPVNTAHPKTTVYSARPIQKVNTAKGKFNTARPNLEVVNVVRANQRHPQKEDQGYVDSVCSRHMTLNMSYLSDFKEFDGGYVTFGGGAKGGKITVPRKNNMYSVDMKNIVPKESLTCIVAKATLDESMLWHRRLVVTDDYSRFTWVFFLACKDETSGILKRFTTEIENLVDKKVKIIRCDNGTEFKNRVMSEFCEKKDIKKEFSVARTPQQNGVAKRRNRTLIEAARTMLANSKLPTTFWAEAVNIACYVQNRVLVVKPHNKTPYELCRGKFDGKSDEGFFVGYSLNSDGPKWLFDIDVLTKSMNYVPVVAGTNSNDFVGTEKSIGAGHSSKETGSSQDYILMPLWKDGVNKENGIDDQKRPENSTQDVNTAGPSINTTSTNVNTGSLNINTISPTVNTAPLEATHADFFLFKVSQQALILLAIIEEEVYACPTSRNRRSKYPAKDLQVEKAIIWSYIKLLEPDTSTELPHGDIKAITQDAEAEDVDDHF